MRILFVLHGPFQWQSGSQVFHYANELAERGRTVAVAGRGDPRAVADVGRPRFECLRLSEVEGAIEGWGSPPDLVHAWTPREAVRGVTTGLRVRHGTPYVVHMEDNEEALLEAQLGVDPGLLSEADLNEAIGPDQYHPIRGPRFLRGASGHTAITPDLGRFATTSRPFLELRPGANWRTPRTDPETLRRRLGILPDEFIVVYPGNMHAANRRDLFSLYLAIALLRREGQPARLVRLGTDYAPGLDESWTRLQQNVIGVGPLPFAEMSDHLALADALVQPGPPNAFNAERLPAKVPECLMTGKPMLIPEVGIGRRMRDGEEALLLRHGDAREIAARLGEIIADRERGSRIGAAGRKFAENTFDTRAIVAGLDDHYQEIVDGFDETEQQRSLVALRGIGPMLPDPDLRQKARRGFSTAPTRLRLKVARGLTLGSSPSSKP